MNTREIAAEYRLREWAQIVQERSESGLSIKAYCQNAGIRENTYYYWQKKLRAKACSQMERLQAPELQQAKMIRGFSEVKLLESPERAPETERIASGSLSIEIAGIRITADSAYPAPKVACLVREMMRQC